jgi:hypothetical protein
VFMRQNAAGPKQDLVSSDVVNRSERSRRRWIRSRELRCSQKEDSMESDGGSVGGNGEHFVCEGKVAHRAYSSGRLVQ